MHVVHKSWIGGVAKRDLDTRHILLHWESICTAFCLPSAHVQLFKVLWQKICCSVQQDCGSIKELEFLQKYELHPYQSNKPEDQDKNALGKIGQLDK